MPLPLIAAAALAIGGAVAQNVQNKNAIKNNETQQASAVGNAKSAYKNAEAQMAKLISANPSPFAGQSIGAPGAVQAGTPANYSGAAPGATGTVGMPTQAPRVAPGPVMRRPVQQTPAAAAGAAAGTPAIAPAAMQSGAQNGAATSALQPMIAQILSSLGQRSA